MESQPNHEQLLAKITIKLKNVIRLDIIWQHMYFLKKVKQVISSGKTFGPHCMSTGSVEFLFLPDFIPLIHVILHISCNQTVT